MEKTIEWNGLHVTADIEVEKGSYWDEPLMTVEDVTYEVDDAEEFSAFLLENDKPAEWADMRHECETWLGTFDIQLCDLFERSL